jgi:hypothetical protein
MNPPVKSTGRIRGRVENLKPWRKGVSGNPKGRPSHRSIFEAALGSRIVKSVDELVEVLVARALEGDARMMVALLDRLVPRIDRHEIDAESAPTKIVLEFARPRVEGDENASGSGDQS